MGTVVHAHHSDGLSAGLEAGKQHCRHDCHGMTSLVGAIGDVLDDKGHHFALHVGQGIALLGDGEGRHLQRGIDEASLQLLPLGIVSRIGSDALGDGRDDLLVRGAVGLQGHHEGHGIEGIIDLVDDIVVEGLRRDDAAGGQAFIQQALLQHGNETAEDVARAEVHPHRGLLGRSTHGLPVKLGQCDPGSCEGRLVLNALIGKLHSLFPPILTSRRKSYIASPRCRSGRWLPARGRTGHSRGGLPRPRSCDHGRGGHRYRGRCRRSPS